MKKILLLLAILCTPFNVYADGDGDRERIVTTKITTSLDLTEKILPLVFGVMDAVWQKTFNDGQCAVFKNTDLLEPFATECVPVPFSVINLLDMCKEQIAKSELAEMDAKQQCASRCGKFVMEYLYYIVEKNDQLPTK